MTFRSGRKKGKKNGGRVVFCRTKKRGKRGLCAIFLLKGHHSCPRTGRGKGRKKGVGRTMLHRTRKEVKGKENMLFQGFGAIWEKKTEL